MKKYSYYPSPIGWFQNDFGPIHAGSQWGSLCSYGIHLWRHEVAGDCHVIADKNNYIVLRRGAEQVNAVWNKYGDI